MRAIVTVPLDPHTTVVPNAPIIVADDCLVWSPAKKAIGRVTKAWGSEDGTAIRYEIDLDGDADLINASLDGLSIDGPERPTAG